MLILLSPHMTLIAGQPQPFVLEGPGEDSPLLFIEKDIITVTIENVFMAGHGAVPYTYCEVYAPTSFNTLVGVMSALVPWLSHAAAQ
jgi:hypothetical protein